ncbi:IS4 family transposase [Lysinibacillus endophyticus]|uniref:IS4 family transposase n=1 Tax=Ureibacillus endophyticus TaxID=1978490 RepID=UPI00209FD560|nr:IS4 family transposase [Lysinibacillus endophyticus]MCP1143174.1 IS4 family transposase [Lysinibacillus endophyticus]MCP1143538.1 IS4 family transposase [Lysinibacillus endophyticus]MCP1146788.1 IS4 family transposase [Lysinibacillus endophyticus]
MDKFTRITSFEQWFSPINLTLFEEQVKIHQLNYYTKKLYMASFMKLLLYAQLHETESLRALSDAVFSDDLQRTIGFESISFSQLGRRINTIPTEFFQTLFLDLVSQIHQKTDFQKQRKTTTPLKIIDSSTLPLNLTNHKWAEFRKTKSGVKLHLRLVFMEKGLSYPDQTVLTNAIEHDRGQLEVFIDDKECLYVFDRGYLDYKRFDRMTDDGYFFVTRLRKNAVVRVLETFSLPEDSKVLSDEMVVIGTTQNRSENVFRRLEILDTKGSELTLLTNRFDLDADEIAEIYKSRWAIELFFKWMKQHLNIKKFYGHSEQAVHNQVYIAMIVFCLNVLAQMNTNSDRSYLEISRYLKAALWKSAHIWLRKIERKNVP